MPPRATAWALLLSLLLASVARGESLLVEAESFEQHGGWSLDTEFVTSMGSPYLLAHGLGVPVKDAETTVALPHPGRYRVWVRTFDWVARWQAAGAPGRFQVLVNGEPLSPEFGAQGRDWEWQDGGVRELSGERLRIALHDLTGFAGRCDAIWLSDDPEARPPAGGESLAIWRRRELRLPDEPEQRGPYDLVVVGGGYAGMGAALSAARLGCKVALIQDRGVLGGNGSSEVRVWAQGLIRRGEFPRIGEIVEEFADRASKSPGRAEEFGDAQKEALVRAEPNIELFLHHHCDQVELDGTRIAAVQAFDTRTSARRRFAGRVFADCTGHGVVGFLAGADWDMSEKGRMGMSNMWAWDEGERPVEFPRTPWALPLTMKDFPYPRDHHGQWFWESGFDKDPIGEAEAIRDWNLRAVFGAFNAMKNGDGREQHRTAFLTWVAYIGGPRESRRLLGDIVLTQEDIVGKRQFPDGCVPSTWSIDLHYPKQQYAEKFSDNPFISIAEHDQRIDRTYGYPIPYRCFYSRNVDNLFMAGRCISVTHEALGTTRVMKTCGMMGEVVGKAASICALQDCRPRDVYTNYLDELKELLRLPGKTRRATLDAPLQVPADAPLARAEGPPSGIDPATLPGVVCDDLEAKRSGEWTAGTGLKGYVGHGYLYSQAKDAAIEFSLRAPTAGRYELRLAYQPHENRGSNVLVRVRMGEQVREQRIDMRKAPPIADGFVSLGDFDLAAGTTCVVELRTEGAGGFVHADAAQLLPVR